ncbi:MAG: TRAP transporter small permease subunit [Elusimicrobia bacterium]|nr:TRAP transporter small permease subunit [Elusimicrobiota bacterium]
MKRFLINMEKAFLVAALMAMVFLAFAQVCLRHFFSSGLVWADTFLRHLVLWIGFFGAALATEEKKHFAINVLERYFSPKLKSLSNLVINLFAFFCLILLTHSANAFFQSERQSPSILFSLGGFQVPSFWMEAILPLGFLLLLVHFAFKLWEDVIQIKGLFSR